jgi:hypothetical protein
MRLLTRRSAVFAATAALLFAGGLGATAHAAPAPTAARTGAHPAQATLADPCTSAVAPSAHRVRGALTTRQVHRRMHSLTRQQRLARGWSADGSRRLPDKGPLGESSLKATIHPAQGTAFKQLAGADGSCATQSVTTAVQVNDGYTTIYTPTMYPPGGSCVELVTVYTASQHSVSAWDWCRSVAFEASVPIDGSFLATYTAGGSVPAYTGRVIRTDAASNTWTAQLYNHTTGRWDTLYTQSGTNQSGRTDGWDINELYSQTDASGIAYSCYAMSGLTFESSGIAVRVNGQWSRASSANSDTHYDQPDSAYDCPDRQFTMVSAYDHWKVVG